MVQTRHKAHHNKYVSHAKAVDRVQRLFSGTVRAPYRNNACYRLLSKRLFLQSRQTLYHIGGYICKNASSLVLNRVNTVRHFPVSTTERAAIERIVL